MTDPTHQAPLHRRVLAEANVAAGGGDRTTTALKEAMATTPKSPGLCNALVRALSIWCFELGAKTHHDLLTALLAAEPGLTPTNLADMQPVPTREAGNGYPEFLTALCTHPNADDDLLVHTLWNVDPGTATNVAAITGSMLPLATCWVRARQWPAIPLALKWVTQPERDLIADTAAAWETWAGTSPARRSFLIARWADFTNQDTMFAAGAGLCAPPAHLPTHAT